MITVALVTLSAVYVLGRDTKLDTTKITPLIVRPFRSK